MLFKQRGWNGFFPLLINIIHTVGEIDKIVRFGNLVKGQLMDNRVHHLLELGYEFVFVNVVVFQHFLVRFEQLLRSVRQRALYVVGVLIPRSNIVNSYFRLLFYGELRQNQSGGIH